MDELFWLTAPDPEKPVTIGSINTAMKRHKKRKGGIHAQIRTWVDEQGTLEHLKVDGTIQVRENLIQQYRFNPEPVETVNERWLTPSELATKAEA